MRKLQITFLTLSLISCASMGSPTINNPEMPAYSDSLTAVAEAAQRCRFNHPLFPDDNSLSKICAPNVISFSYDGCKAFDDAIQVALKPMHYCASADLQNDETAAAHCGSYINKFLGNPCIGPYAIEQAFHERSMTKHFRTAIANGMSEEKAANIYLHRVIRLRPPQVLNEPNDPYHPLQ